MQERKDKNQICESSLSGTAAVLNKWQLLHLEGKFNVYEPIPQEVGEPLPPLAVQWKEDAKRRFGADSRSLAALGREKNANSRNR